MLSQCNVAVMLGHRLDAGPTLSQHLAVYRACWEERCDISQQNEINESGFRPPLCTYRLNKHAKLNLGGLRQSTLTLGHGGFPQY